MSVHRRYVALYVGHSSSQAATNALGKLSCTLGCKEVGLTARGDVRRHIVDILSEDDRKTGVKVVIDVAVEEPGAGVVGAEADGDVVAGGAGADDIALDGVDVVVGVAAGAAHDPELVL